MDFSGDVKQAIPRPAAAGPSPLLQGWREFRRSGAPVRFLCFERGAWADVDAEASLTLRAAFLDTRVVAEAYCGGRPFLFDFLRLARIDAATAEEVPLGWIDDRGACFFPAPHTATKRKRAQQEDGASSGVESSSSSDDTVDSGRPSKAPRGAWGRAVRLDEADKFYQVVRKLFLSGIAPRVGGVAITAVHKVAQGARARAFQQQGQLLAAARGEGGGNAKFAWYGAPEADVAAAVEHGFGRTNSRVLGHRAHGDGVHLSPPQSPYTSAMLAKADENGEAHIVLCRVLMGRPETVAAGSSQFHPSSDDYDSAVDNMQNPKWYVVWSTDMNTRILPEYVVSFKCPSLQQAQVTSEATSELRKPSPASRDMFPTLLAEIQRFVPTSKLQTLQGTYSRFKKGHIKKDQFIRFLRAFIGDRVLTTVAKKLRGY
ncbi:hypothetical protein QYE76_069633 [Lolium multiflorum]|uniref:Poly [ADP-ribose] polymerase n=1 Tax=Lolium multiflorum TaxID=4521 RepID=A0AAD8WD52_LOLMU|nr:hypothetical protein QYE76_069633 [Lolium multiflorum]